VSGVGFWNFHLSLGILAAARYHTFVKEKWHKWLPYIFMAIAGLSRWPGLFPPNFSAFYGLAFCAGAFFPGLMKWWLPFGTLLVSDLGLDFYYLHLGYKVFDLPLLKYQCFNYLAFGILVLLGRSFNRRSSWLALLSGGLLGAVLFYLITNTASWLFNPFNNPEYTKDLHGWFIALTQGTAGWPQTWEFFRNTLMSGGLFTGLFAGAMKLTESAESAEEKEPKATPEEEAEAEPAPEGQ
jgi:hypothetical protein